MLDLNKKETKLTLTVILLVLALVSVFVWAPAASSAEHHAQQIAYLNDKCATVLELAAASTTASTAITLAPGDAGGPIANKLADLSSVFLIVVCAIYLEKYLLTITGLAAFKLLLPAAAVLGILWVWLRGRCWGQLALKITVLALAIYFVVPVSVQISSMIEDTYSVSIEATLESAQQAADTAQQEESGEKEGGILSGFVSGLQQGVSNAVTKAETLLNNFIEALAVMLVTSCLIPVLVLLFFVWIIRMVAGTNFTLPPKGYFLHAGKEEK